jgi:hypothetical protein
VTRNARALLRIGVVALLCAASLSLTPSAASAAISLVQQKNANSSSATSLAATFTTAVSTTAGNVIVVVGGTSTGSLSGVSGGGVGNWFKAQSSTTNTHIEIWYGAVDVATNTSTTPITATAATAGGMWMTVTEWNGVSLAIDKTAAQAGTTSPASAGSITTTNAADLVMFGVADNTGSTYGTPTGGTWTALTAITTPEAQTTWYQIAVATATFNPTVTETASTWDAAILALKGCAATTSDASYVAANAQNGAVKVYWTSPNPVLIIRNTTNTFGTPTAGTAYKVGDASPGGSGTIVYSGSGNTAPGTFSEAIANGTYYYKVFTNCDLTYSTGVVLNVVPSATIVWSYATSATTLAAAGIDSNDVVVWGGNDNKIHGANAVDGTLEYPVFTTPAGAIQSRPTIIPDNYSITGLNIAYVASQDGFVYAINTLTGAQVWKSPSLAASGSLQGGTAVWLQSMQGQAICGATTDVVFVGTRTTTVQTNSVYALNGGTTTVTTSSGGKCVAGSIAPGGIMWQFTGATGGTPNLHYISSGPYLDYTNNALWVTSRANATTTQPSLWKFNPTNGMLFNGTSACGSGVSTSCWNLSDVDTTPVQSSTGAWMYVTTAGTAPLLKAVPMNGGTVVSYTPTTGSGAASPPYTLGTPTTLGATSTIAFVNSESKTNASAANTCVIDMSLASPSTGMTAGNTIIVGFASATTSAKVTSIQDSRGSAYVKRTFGSFTGVVVEIWAADIAPGSGTTITVNLNSSVTSVCSAGQYSGVGGIFVLNGGGIGSGSTANPTSVRTTLDTNNWIVAMFGVANSTAATAASGTNLRESVAIGGTAVAGALADKSSATAASVTASITHAAANWASINVELRSVQVETVLLARSNGFIGLHFQGSAFSVLTAGSCGGASAGNMVDDGKGNVYVGGTNGKLYKYNGLTSGCWSTTVTLSGATTQIGEPTYDGILDRIYVGSADGHVYAVTAGF